jgi:hypothetical protein
MQKLFLDINIPNLQVLSILNLKAVTHYAGTTLLKNIEQLLALENHFTIIDDKNIRQRKYK